MKIQIVNSKHPHYGEIGTVVARAVELNYVGPMDHIRNSDGAEFFAYTKDYIEIDVA